MNEEQLKLKELSQEQILDLAEAAGRKLGFLLATSGLADEAKDAIIAVLDYATPAQLDELTDILETGYLEAKNQALNKILAEKLAEIKLESDKAEEKLEQETLKKLENL